MSDWINFCGRIFILWVFVILVFGISILVGVQSFSLCSILPYVQCFLMLFCIRNRKKSNLWTKGRIHLSHLRWYCHTWKEKNHPNNNSLLIRIYLECCVSFSLLNWFAHTRPTEPHTRGIRAPTRFKKVAALNRKFLRLNDFHSVSNIPWIFRNLCTFLCSVVFQWCSNGGSTQYTKYHVLCIHLYWWCTLRTT